MKKTHNDALHSGSGDAHHHLTPVMVTGLGLQGRNRPVRAPLPTAVAYSFEKPAAKVVQPVQKQANALPKSRMFFKGNTAKLDKDPFLQRLSRLN